MNYKNKLMGLSLILLAAFSACTDDVENGGRDSGTDDHRITFAVGTESPDARTRADGSLPDAAGSYETNSVEMQGKLDGKNVYLTAEVSDGLPGDDQPLTRGTQVTGGAQVDEFSVSAAILDANVFEPETLDVMYNVKVAKDNASSTWTTGTPYYWPTGKKLTFFAWYPYNSKNLTIPKDNNVKDTKLFYEIPEQVADQEDFMMANSYEVSETSSVPIFFRHMLTAVKFKTSNNIPACTVKSISLKGVKYKGYHNWQAHNSIILSWNPDADTRDFTLDFPNGKEVAENTETELTGKGETFFMMPQTLSDDAKIEVVLNDGTADFTVGASIGGTKWEMGKTYTYHISNNFVSLVTTNDKFVAFTDETLTDQVAFFLSASATTAGTTGEILAPAGVTVTPTTFASGASNLSVKVTWPKDMGNHVSMEISFAGKKKQILMSRQTPTEGDAYWLYSLPETTSQHLENDIIGLQNASESDWIAMTSSPTYTKDNYSQVIYDNSSKGDIYLQTLSIPSANRFASLLATKEDFSQNVMYCVEQKALTADFGFKDCERNISRESEKWNIVLNGGHFKEDVTNLKARVVISSDVPDTQITDLGRDLTCGDPVAISVDKATSTGVSATPYVKKRWDNLQNNTANNGTRKVNVQVKNDNMDEWYDCGSDGQMADRFTWGNSFAIGYNQYHSGAFDQAPKKIVGEYYEVHQKHPMFGLHRWSIMKDRSDKNIMDNALYMVYCSARGFHSWNNSSIYRNRTNGGWSYIACNQANSLTNPENPNYNDVYNGGRFITIGVNGRNWRWSNWVNYTGPLTVWIPVVYTDCWWNKLEDGTTRNQRPTDDTPIVGQSVNE